MANNVPEGEKILEHETGYAVVSQKAILVTSDGRIDQVTLIVPNRDQPLRRDETGAIERTVDGKALVVTPESSTTKKAG